MKCFGRWDSRFVPNCKIFDTRQCPTPELPPLCPILSVGPKHGCMMWDCVDPAPPTPSPSPFTPRPPFPPQPSPSPFPPPPTPSPYPPGPTPSLDTQQLGAIIGFSLLGLGFLVALGFIAWWIWAKGHNVCQRLRNGLFVYQGLGARMPFWTNWFRRPAGGLGGNVDGEQGGGGLNRGDLLRNDSDDEDDEVNQNDPLHQAINAQNAPPVQPAARLVNVEVELHREDNGEGFEGEGFEGGFDELARRGEREEEVEEVGLVVGGGLPMAAPQQQQPQQPLQQPPPAVVPGPRPGIPNQVPNAPNPVRTSSRVTKGMKKSDYHYH